MSESQISEATKDEIPPATKALPKTTWRAWVIDWLSFVQSLFLKLFVIVPILAVVIVTGRDFFRQPVLIEEIGLPSVLSDRGYSGVVAAHRLWDAIKDIQDKSGTSKTQTSLLTTTRQLDVVEPGSGISLKGVSQMLRAVAGWQQTRIAGEFICLEQTCDTSKLALRLRIMTGDRMELVPVGELGDRSIDEYFKDSALMVLERIDPYVAAAYYHRVPKKPESARRIAMHLITINHHHSAWAANLIGVLERDDGNIDTSIEWFERSITIAGELGPPDFTPPINNWGNSLGRLGRHEEAIEKFKKATEIEPTYTVAWNGWGNSLGRLERHEEAIEKFRRATEIDPGFLYAWNGWANRLSYLGRHEEAIEKYQRAIDLDPKFLFAWNGWGNSLGNLDRHEEAIEKFKRATEIDPKFHYAWNGWGNRLSNLGRHEEAIEKYQRAAEIDPTFVGAWNGWATSLSKVARSTDGRRCTILDLSLEFLERAKGSAPEWFEEKHEAEFAVGDCP